MSQNDLGVGRPSVKVPTTEQTAAAAQTAHTARSGKATRTTDNLTVNRATANRQYSTNVAASGPDLPAPSNVNATDLMAILFGLRQKHTESSIESAEQRINDRSVDKAIKSKEMISKLQKVAHSKSDVGNILAKVFAWVGVALSFVVAGVIGVVSGGAAAAPLLIIATMSAALLIAQQSGLTDKAMDAMGMDDNAKMGFSLGITIVMLAVNIIAVAASGGASAFSVANQAAKTITEVAATGGEAATEIGAAAAKTAAEISTSVAEVATKTTESIAGAAAKAVETSVEAGTKTAESIANAAAETAEVSAEAGTKTAESIANAAAETAEVSAEAGTKAAEGAAKTSADVAENVAAKAPSATVKVVAEKLGTTSSRVLKVIDKVRSGANIVHGVSELAVGGLSIGTAAKSYEASNARADAMRDKATLTKMQAQDEEDMRRIRNMIEQLENAQTAIMSTISKSDEVALQIRQTI